MPVSRIACVFATSRRSEVDKMFLAVSVYIYIEFWNTRGRWLLCHIYNVQVVVFYNLYRV